MILGNYSVLNKNPSRSTGGLSFKGSLAPYDSQYNFYVSDADNGKIKYASSPTATQPPYSYVLAPKGGELSATTTIKGTGIVAGSMIMGKSCTANMSGIGGISGLLGLLTSLSANMSGVGGLSGGLGLSLALFASMSGSGSLSSSLSMSVPFIANMSGSGNLVGNLKGNASLSATIYVNSGSATIKELVDGVWNAIATEYNTSGTMGDAVQTGGGGGGGGSGATPAQIWSYANRTLTESAGLTTEQAEQLNRIDERVDTPVSEIAVGWNPYIEGVNGLKKGIQKIVDKIEDKGNEVKGKIESEVKTIVIPEQKEPIVNVTTEKIDTKEFLKAIKDIKPEINITTETINNEPILSAIREVGRVSEIRIPEYKEPKEVDLGPIQEVLAEVKSKIEEDSNKIDMIEDYIEEKKEEHKKEIEEEERKEKEIEEEENMRRPLPSSFIATLN